MQAVHVCRAEHQAKMIHVRGHTFASRDGAEIDNRLGGNPGRHKTNFPSPEFLQPQQFQTEQLMIEVHGAFNIAGIDHNMI
jgi:hypothetical protein